MQSQLFAVLAPGREKSGQTNRRSRRCRLQPLRCRTEANGLNFAFDTAQTAGFDLLRLVPDHTFRYRHTGRSET